MTIQEIARARAMQPFEPFRIYVADGQFFDVWHPENITQTGNGRLIAISMKDHFITLDLLLVTGIARPIPKQSSGSRRRRAS